MNCSLAHTSSPVLTRLGRLTTLLVTRIFAQSIAELGGNLGRTINKRIAWKLPGFYVRGQQGENIRGGSMLAEVRLAAQ